MANFKIRGMVGRFTGETTMHCYIQNIAAVGLTVSEKKTNDLGLNQLRLVGFM